VNDVKEICLVALEDPAPPLREAHEALAIARRSTLSRDRLRLASAGLAVAVVVSAVVVAVGVTASDTTDRQTATGPAPAGPGRQAPQPAQPPPVPASQTAHAHGPAIARLLVAAVPPGYATRPWLGDRYAAATWFTDPGMAMYVSSTSLVVSAGGREGMLSATIGDNDQPVPTGDLCSAAVTHLGATALSHCEVVTVNGEPIVVTTSHEENYGDVRAATRFLQGGYLTVRLSRAVPVFETEDERPPDAGKAAHGPATTDSRPPLTELPLSAQQLAELAGNPAMLP